MMPPGMMPGMMPGAMPGMSMGPGGMPGSGSQGGAPSFMSKAGSKAAVTEHDDSSSQVHSLKSSSLTCAPERCFQVVVKVGVRKTSGGIGSCRVGVQESEEELNERLRQLKGLDKERDKNKKLSKQEQEEENLFKKNKGEMPSDSESA